MKTLVAVAIIILSAIWLRLAYLQLYQGDKYARLSQQITLRHETLLAPRGLVLDRHNESLANNQAIIEAYVERQQIKNPDLNTWATLLEVTPEDLNKKWEDAKKTPIYHPFLIASNLTLAHLLKWRQAKLNDYLNHTETWQGLELRYRPARDYRHSTEGFSFSHLLGYIRNVTDDDTHANSELIAQDLIGATGVERLFDDRLRGKNGNAWLWVDAYGKEVNSDDNPDFTPRIVPPQSGEDLHLTIDARLQNIAYNAFAGKAGALVALHLPDGEVRSLVSTPGYDNNLFIGGISNRHWKELNSDPLNPLLNRATQGMYPPGSTYKIVTAAAALELGKVNDTEQVYCPGYFIYGGHRFGCWNKRGHGSVTIRKALEASCDVFFYTMGLRLDVDELAQMAERFGLGRRTPLAFPSERAGFIPTRRGLQERYKQSWSKGHIFSVTIGQGSNVLTPLQSALMTARFATNNAELSPSLLPSSPTTFTPLLSEATHAIIADGLKNVIYGPSGTAGRFRTLPFTLAGKTGTAQAGGEQEDHAWFVTYAPVENPEIAVAVLVEHGGHGGAAAAPIAAEYLKAYFPSSKSSATNTRTITTIP